MWILSAVSYLPPEVEAEVTKLDRKALNGQTSPRSLSRLPIGVPAFIIFRLNFGFRESCHLPYFLASLPPTPLGDPIPWVVYEPLHKLLQ